MRCRGLRWCVLPFVTVLVAGTWPSLAQDVPPESTDAALAMKELAALTALCNRIAAHDYRLSLDRAEQVVLVRLRQMSGPPPKPLPSVEELRASLDTDFETTWQDMLNQAAAGLDPQGALNIVERLRTLLERKTALRRQAAARHAEFVQQTLPQTLEEVGRKIAADQTEAGADVLRGLLEAGRLDAAAIAEAPAGDPSPLAQSLQKDLVASMPAALREVLLVESHDRLAQTCTEIVTDGMAQLEEQLQALQRPTAAMSPPGIARELERRLQQLADQQREQRAEKALRPAYGVFQRVADTLAAEAMRHFDQRVDEAGKAVAEAVDRRELPSKDQLQRYAAQLRQLIEGDPVTHHRGADSKRALRSAMAEFVAEGRQWLAGRVTMAFVQRKSPDDADVKETAVQESALQLLDVARSRSQVRWAAIERVLRQRYEGDVLNQVRDQIAGEQAARHAPELIRNAWIPTEDDLNSSTLPLPLSALAALPVWRGDPPAETAVLEETWQLWQAAAEKALEMADNARTLQLGVVDGLRATIRAEMRREPQVDRDEWAQRYRDRATSQWRSIGSPESARYPDLFNAALDRITAILVELLDEAAEPSELDVPENAGPMVEPAKEPVMETPVEPPATEPVEAGAGATSEPAGTSPSGAAAGSDGDGAGANDTDGTAGADVDQADTGDAHGGDQGDGGETAEETEQAGGDEMADEEQADPSTEESQSDGAPATAEPGPARQQAVPPSRLDLFYRVGFWVLFLMMLLMATAWYGQVRHLRRLLAMYQPPGPLDVAR